MNNQREPGYYWVKDHSDTWAIPAPDEKKGSLLSVFSEMIDQNRKFGYDSPNNNLALYDAPPPKIIDVNISMGFAN